MLVRRPDYYDEFQCIAKDCPATCCAGWEIGIDAGSMKRYEQMEGAFANRLHNSINKKRSSFEQYDRKCIFLNEENLCDMYIEAGPEMLCHTCRTYPRHLEDYEMEQELSLGISCPEVARIILGKQNPVQWVSAYNKKEEDLDPDFNCRMYAVIQKARQSSIEVFQSRDLPVLLRMSIVLAMSHDLQRRVREQDTDAMERLLRKYSNPMVLRSLKEKVRGYRGREKERHQIMKKMLKTMSQLAVLNPEWKAELAIARQTLKGLSDNEYMRLYHDYWEEREHTQYEVMLEQLICYYVMNYFSTSVYDDNIYSKMKFAIFSTLVIQEMWFVSWIQARAKLEFDEMVRFAYQYGREVEHLDENLRKLEHIFANRKKYCLEELLITLQ